MAKVLPLLGYYPMAVWGLGGKRHWVFERQVGTGKDKVYQIWYAQMNKNGVIKFEKRLAGKSIPYAEMPHISCDGMNLLVSFQTKDGDTYHPCEAISTDEGKTWK